MDPSRSQHSDNRFEALAESAPDAILTIDEASTILSVNAAAERIFGYSRDELVGASLSMLMPKRYRARHNAGIARYLRTGERHISWSGVELAACTKDGREIPVEISFGEFVDVVGRRVFSGFVRDISEKKRQLRELEEARETAERALKALGTLGRITDVALGRATYDEMLAELLQRLREELEADEATVLLMSADGRQLHVQASNGLYRDDELGMRVPVGAGFAGRVAASGKPMVLTDVAHADVVSRILRSRIASAAAVPVYSGGSVIGVLHVGMKLTRTFTRDEIRLLEVVAERMAGVLARTRLFSEIQDRAQEEAALRALAQSIASAVRIPEIMHEIAKGALGVSGADGAYVEQVISPNGEVEIVAAAGEQLMPVGQRVPFPGSLTEEIIGQREPVFLLRMHGVGASMAPYLDRYCHDCSVLVVPLVTDTEVLGALVLLRAADQPAFEHGVITRVRTLADLASIALQRLVSLAESERRRTEAEAAVRSRDEVLSIVSHDLRNPVSTVSMAASLLADPGIPLTDEQRRQQIAVIQRSARRMNRLIQDLLDVARIEGQRLRISCRVEDPGALAGEAFESFRQIAAEKDVALSCDAARDLPPVNADRDRVLQVLSNFLNNALKFTPAGGRVTIETRRAEHGVRFTICDTGPGISQSDQLHVFDRFWQAKRTAHLGSGLGLAIAKGIAEAHGGRVSVRSEPGKGSAFSLWLPAAREA